MDIADEIADYLDTNGFGTVGTDIFVEQIPDGTNGLYVSEIGSQPHKYLPLEEAAIDVYAKNTSAQTAKTTLKNIKDLMHRMHSTQQGSAYMYTILAISAVENVGRDLEYAKLFKITLSVIYRDTDLIS